MLSAPASQLAAIHDDVEASNMRTILTRATVILRVKHLLALVLPGGVVSHHKLPCSAGAFGTAFQSAGLSLSASL
jgi:hypothetical protein